MQTAKELKIFESKSGTVVLQAVGTRYVVTTAQRIRMDLVWATESVRSDIKDALAKFEEHKECFLSHGHCIGDNSALVTKTVRMDLKKSINKLEEHWACVSRLGQSLIKDSHIR